MRPHLLILFSVLCNFSISQQIDSTTIDTSYFQNMKPYYIIGYAFIDGINYQHGIYREYDTSGVLLIEGNYKASPNSIECVDCYSVNYYDSTFTQYTIAHFHETRTGVWNFYYPNGKLKMQGEYSPKVHEEFSSLMLLQNCNFLMGPSGVGVHFLEHGPWIYYNEYGEITNRKWYYQGRLIQDEIAYCSEPVMGLKGDWTWAYSGVSSTEDGDVNVLLFLRTGGAYDLRIIFKNQDKCETRNFDQTVSGQWKYDKGILMLFPDSISPEVNTYKMITQEGCVKFNNFDQEIISKYNAPVYFKCEEQGRARKIRFSFTDPCVQEIWEKHGYIMN